MMMVNIWRFIRNMLKKYKRSEYLIGISSGHSKKDMGAFCEITNKYEYSYVGELSFKLQELLKELGYKVYSPDPVSDELGYPLHLRRSVDLLNLHEVDIAIELHLNRFKDVRASGCETLTNEQGISLATIIQEEVVKLGFRDRGVKQLKNKYFLNKTECPAIITEPGFLSSEKDVAKITEKGFQNEFCVNVAVALDRYHGIS